MNITYHRTIFIAIFLIIVVSSIGNSLKSQPFETWETYQGDDGRTGYSSLEQINKDNVDQLEVAWTFHTGDLSENDDYTLMECNPIVVDEVMYVASPKLKIIALQAATGKEIWRFDPFKGENLRGLCRAVTYWEENRSGEPDKRILFTAGSYLYALDATNGKIITDFGKDGKVSLNEGLARDPSKLSVKSNSPGAVYNNLLILGSSVGEGYGTPPGYVRAYDIRSGELQWTFHTIPQPGEPGYETWEKDSWKHIGGANVWTGLTLDKERGIVYLPVASPNMDYYGGRRKGKNLYGSSLVALDAATGEYLWHYQTVHHDIWDYDLPAPPNLVTMAHEGRETDAIAQVTKTGFVFLFDRVSGESLFPIHEKKVPKSTIEGEEAWPTQPFPEKPAPFIRQHFTEEDITDISPEAHEAVLKQFKKLRNEGMFTPPDTSGTLLLPGSRGGANWGGPAYDPTTDILYISAKETAEIATMKKEPIGTEKVTTLYKLGQNYYVTNCTACHGIDRQGQPPSFPSLVDVQARRSKEEILSTIKNGAGRMPAFKRISSQEQEALLAYLFEQKNSRKVVTENKETDSMRYVNITGRGYFNDPDGYPAVKPPWGTLNALDLTTGDYVWKIPLGVYPELSAKGIPPTGTENWGGPIVTAGGLVFIAATVDKKFRAFDKATGQLLWETDLPTAGIAKPATYMSHGKQFVVIAAGGGRGTESGDAYIAFALPD